MEKLKVRKLKKGDTIGLLIASSCNRQTERMPKIEKILKKFLKRLYQH